MELYLAKSLMGWTGLSKGKEQTSEVRGGGYAARVQTGYEKDGSPKYRYFKTQDEYESYLQGKGKKKGDKKESKKREEKLSSKQKEEQKESKKKQSELFTAQAKKEKRRVKKGIPDLVLKVK